MTRTSPLAQVGESVDYWAMSNDVLLWEEGVQADQFVLFRGILSILLKEVGDIIVIVDVVFDHDVVLVRSRLYCVLERLQMFPGYDATILE